VKAAGLVAATLVALALQTTLSRFLANGHLAVDLVLVVVIYAALSMGPVAALLTGTLAGLMQDALSSGVVGMGGLAKTMVGFVAGIIETQFIIVAWPLRFVVFAGATLVHAVIYMGAYHLLGLRTFDSPYIATIEQALGNAVVGVVAFQLVEQLPVALERRRLDRPRRRR
jgi:rod shape-determining protein MreD